AIERSFLQRFYREDPMLGLLFTFGLALTIEQSLRPLWGTPGLPSSIPDALRGTLLVVDLIYSYFRLAVLGVSAAAVLGCWAMLTDALAALPSVLRVIGLTESLGTEIALFALVGLGFNLLLGYTGLLSFGHGLFFGFAAYAAALSQQHWFHDSIVWPVAFAVAASALLGLIVGFFALRRRGVYFSLLTLAFTALAFFIAFRWTEFTGGESGLRGIARPAWGAIDLNDQRVFYALTALVV